MKKHFCALVLVAALAGLSQAAPSAPAGSGASKSIPVKRILPDAQIERNIRAKLAKSKMAGTEHFTVSVQNGVATFEGKTNVIQHKGTATRIAHTSGAIGVQNHIQVSEAAKAAAAAKLAKRAGLDATPQRATVLQAKVK